MERETLATTLRSAIGKHGAWRLRLKTAVAVGHSNMTAQDAACAGCCEFGKWLSAPEQQRLAETPQFRVINRLHTEFHETAGRVIGAIDRGESVAAARLLDTEFAQQSEHLVAGLNKWHHEAQKGLAS